VPNSTEPTVLEMVDDVVGLAAGAVTALLPLFVLSVPCFVLLLPLALVGAVAALAGAILAAPFLIVRALLRRPALPASQP
jgi:hypothetical protein